MRIHVLSDLHLEFAPIALPAVEADVVVLAGDIGVRTRGLAWALQTFKGAPVVYVAGNHEYYGAAIPQLTDELRGLAAGSNVSFLDGAEVVIGGVRFLGATLWTDFALYGDGQREAALAAAQLSLNDFQRIRKSPGEDHLHARDTLTFHARARSFLEAALARPHPGPTVVVTHHAATPNAIPARFRGDPLSPAFASDLGYLLDGRAALWIHGHTHQALDDRSKPTRVVSNQRGYPDEPVEGFEPGLVVEV